MRLTPVTPAQLYARLQKQFQREVDALKSQLSVVARDTKANADVSNQDSLGIKNQIESLRLTLELSKSEASDSTAKTIDMLTSKLANVDASGDVATMQSSINDISIELQKAYTESNDVDNIVDNSDYEYLLAEFKKLEERVVRNQSRAQWLSTGSGGTGGGAIEIRQDGVIITDEAKCLNFVGDDVLVQQDPLNPDCLNVYIPPPTPPEDGEFTAEFTTEFT